MHQDKRSANSIGLTAATAKGMDHRRPWARPPWIGLILLTLLLSTGCGQAAPPSSLAGCPAGTCVTSTPPVTVVAPTTSPQAEPGLSATPRPALVADAPVASPPPVATESAATPVAFQSESVALGPIIWATAIDPETRSPQGTASVIPSDATTIYATIAVFRHRSPARRSRHSGRTTGPGSSRSIKS